MASYNTEPSYNLDNLIPSCRKYLQSLPSNIFNDDADIHGLREALVNNEADLNETLPKIDVFCRESSIPDLTDNHSIPITIIRPKKIQENTVLPAFIFLPGGGFCFPGTKGHKYLASKIAYEANCTVIFVHYSLSPEVQAPVALEEVYSIAKFITSSKTTRELQIDPKRVAMGGDSSGANLTAAFTLLANRRKDFENPLLYQVLYYPLTNNDFDTESYKLCGNDQFSLNTQAVRWFVKQWLGTGTSKNDPLAFPLKASIEELAGVPPAFVVSAEADVLRDETESYGRKLIQAGVQVTSIRVNGVIHGFLSVPELFGDESFSIIEMTAFQLCKRWSVGNC